MLIGGPVRHQFVLSNSWEPVGNREPAFRAAGRELLEIGTRSALAFYRHSLGPHSSPALEFPLAVYEDENSGFYIRSPMDYNDSTGGVVFSTPIPQGASVQLTEATRGGLLEDMGLKLEGLAAHAGPWVNTAACLVFSCATRKQILGTQTSKEIELLRQKLPDSLPILGFYSYGEISPIPGLQRSWLHNCTMVALLFGEEDQTGLHASAPPIPMPEPFEDGMAIDVADHVAFLQKKLERSEAYRERLELNKDLTTALLRKINYEINAARLEIKRKNDMLARTLALADEIQRNLLPERALETRFLDIAGTSVFCSETGGDYYDVVIPDAGHCLRVVVGDVTGHGIEAALLMTTVRALLRARMSQPGDLAQVVADVNRQLARDVKDSGRFVTLFFLSLDPEAGTMEWVRAGHDPAVWYDPAHDRFKALRGPGVALGIDDRAGFTVGRRTGLREGHILCLGTDGIWEARNETGDAFGKARLLTLVKAFQDLSASGMQDAIMAELTRFRGNRELEDDITLVIIKVKSLPGDSDRISP
jgi:serine phosphatase RsbU (regulator of sigma subunit)